MPEHFKVLNWLYNNLPVQEFMNGGDPVIEQEIYLFIITQIFQ
jgi:hypothetical protein